VKYLENHAVRRRCHPEAHNLGLLSESIQQNEERLKMLSTAQVHAKQSSSSLKNKQRLLNLKGPQFFHYDLACPQTEAITRRQQHRQ